jgi:hypothetical protein
MSPEAVAQNLIYLPSVQVHRLPVAPVGKPLSVEKQIYLMMILHPLQGRKGCEWNDLLAMAATDKCLRQAHEGWAGHVDPQSRGPNWMIKQFGYQLPDWYSQELDANNIESLSHNGDGRPDEVWIGLLNSPGHRVHVLGLDPFYQMQVQIGIGYYHLETSDKRHYWAIISAPTEGTPTA